MEIEIKNATITGTMLDISQRGVLTAWLQLDYGGSGQAFGGLALYLPESYTHHKDQKNLAGQFIFRVLEVLGVDKWEDLKGINLRVKCNYSRIESIGHIVKDEWYNPSEEFKRL